MNIDPQIRSVGSLCRAARVHVFRIREESLTASSGHPPVTGTDLVGHIHGRVGLSKLDSMFVNDRYIKAGSPPGAVSAPGRETCDYNTLFTRSERT